MVQKKIPFKAARLEAEKEIEGSVPQKGKSYANAASAAIGMQTPAPNPPAPTSKKTQKMSQNGEGLPNAVRAEALALAIDLRESLKTKRNSFNAKPNAPRSNGAKQTPKSKTKKGGPTNQTQAKPGKSTAPAPQAAADKQASKPAKQPAPKAGKNKAAASAPQAAVAKQASKPDKNHKDPASAPQAAGPPESVPSTSKAKPGDNPASAPQAAGMERALETALPSSDCESEMEVTPAPASQAAEVKQDPKPGTASMEDQGTGSQSPASSPNSLKKDLSFAAAAKEGALAKSKERNKPEEGYNFEVKLAKQRAKRPWSKNSRPKSIEPPVSTQNRFGALGCSDWTGSQDPEELDDYASFPEN